MKPPTRTALAAAAIGLLLSGCLRPAARPPVPEAHSPAAPGSSNPGTVGEAPAEAATADPNGPGDKSGGSLEGRFSYRTMDQYVEAVVPLITEWMDATWRRMPQPRQVLYVPSHAEGPESCLEPGGRRASYSAVSYEYCGADETIYVGQDMLWEFYTRTGDAGPAVGLAHEFGHHIQQQVGVPDPTSAAQSVRHEDQADCIAGAWAKYMDQTNRMEYPDDLEDIDALFPLIGSAEGPDRDHGTAQERLDAFAIGFDGGVAACNDYYPTAPLIVS